MKKLKSFQLPLPLPQQSQIESTLPNHLHPPTQQQPLTSQQTRQSSSFEINPIRNNGEECEKENIRCENHHECVGDMTSHVVSENNTIPGTTSPNPDLFNVVLLQQQQQQQETSETRPRQYGRRSNPIRISSLIMPESVNHATAVSKNFFSLFLIIFVHTCM